MIELIDNLGYSGNLPNFDRDNMTWEQMESQTVLSLDQGHIVYCTSEEQQGSWIFTGDTGWKKIIEKDGTVTSSFHEYIVTIIDPEVKTITITKSIHSCGDYPDINVYYENEIVYPDIEFDNEHNVIISWGKVNISEELPLTIKLTGK